MRNKIILLIGLFCVLCMQAQTDHRLPVGVDFQCEGDAKDTKYAPVVVKKVVEMLVNTKRFRILDRTSQEAVRRELELQKSEAFMDSKNTVEQDAALAATRMINIQITKLPIYAMKVNGNTSGYKCAIDFMLSVQDVETGESTVATRFQGKASKEMLSPQSAINEAMESIAPQIYEYFRKNFPLTCQILKIDETNGKGAKTVLLDMGQAQGINVGDEFTVEYNEMLNGKPFPTEIAKIKVKTLKGADFAIAEVYGKDAGKQILSYFESNTPLICTMIIKK